MAFQALSFVLPMVLASPLLAFTATSNFEPTYGLELTFTNGYLIRKGKKEGINNDGCPASRRARDQWARKMSLLCAERWGNESCEVIPGERRGYKYYTVQYRDGWFYNITVDPLVIEITAKPMTLNQARSLRYRIENDIFRFASQEMSVGGWFQKGKGLFPSRSVGGGHIHIGFDSAFAHHTYSALFVRNFLVDFSNHPTLAFLSLNKTKNDPPISLLKYPQRRAFHQVLDWFDKKKPSVYDFVKQVQGRVYYDTYRQPTEKDPEAWFPPQKYQAMNLTRLVSQDYTPSEKTIEIRSLRPQKDANDLIRILTLLEKRLELIKSYLDPIPYEPDDRGLEFLSKKKLMERARCELKSYVEGAGLNFKNYQDLLDKK
ncbi:MAG: hypothetical protein AB8C84_08915 [Oligoflexales bacterium]